MIFSIVIYKKTLNAESIEGIEKELNNLNSKNLIRQYSCQKNIIRCLSKKNIFNTYILKMIHKYNMKNRLNFKIRVNLYEVSNIEKTTFELFVPYYKNEFKNVLQEPKIVDNTEIQYATYWAADFFSIRLNKNDTGFDGTIYSMNFDLYGELHKEFICTINIDSTISNINYKLFNFSKEKIYNLLEQLKIKLKKYQDF